MINFKDEICKIIAENVDGISYEDALSMVEVPTDTKMGDYAFPCFKLAKVLRKAPPLIAKDIAGKLAENQLFEKVEQVNAYVNMFLSKKALVEEAVTTALDEGEHFGGSEKGKGKKVIVEYSSPNIAKPFHIGHIRSTVIGNSIYKIFELLGYEVIRINHLGDYGTQFGKMICAYRRWGNKEDVVNEPIKTLLGYYTKFHKEAEKDPSLDDEAREIFAKLEKGEPAEVELWQWFREESLKEFNRVYDMLGITFDSYNGESFYSDKMPRFVKELEEKGILEESQGAHIVNLEDAGLGVALITKSDGSTLYITRDIAAAVYRKETYDFYKNIYVVASQQNLHFQQWIEIVERLGYEWARDCVHVPFGLVSLEEGTMSTREGRVVFLEDVLNKAVEKTKEIMVEKNPEGVDIDQIAKDVGIGAVMFQELSNNRIKDYTFKWDKVLNFDGETGPYVQYTHARSASLLRKAGISPEDIKAAKDLDFSLLQGDSSFALAKLIYQFPTVVEDAGDKYEPSIVTRHIVNIAQAFNRFYHDEHILVEDEKEKLAKLALVLATKQSIRNGLALLGINAPEKM
ncbi:MAG: arginine--tRNA ligase [Peptostreptococcaceae bacterium]|nr:arginine--tRNA ligase [Peptostreptococcaceae bacterium]MDY5739526.1 arginine--tRNA ligase [Anaerovoracaceae bacterium]SFE49466.1 arginyl-tRNA synthetase [Peptostreptococcaceae bacterium pGA-8]